MSFILQEKLNLIDGFRAQTETMHHSLVLDVVIDSNLELLQADFLDPGDIKLLCSFVLLEFVLVVPLVDEQQLLEARFALDEVFIQFVFFVAEPRNEHLHKLLIATILIQIFLFGQELCLEVYEDLLLLLDLFLAAKP